MKHLMIMVFVMLTTCVFAQTSYSYDTSLRAKIFKRAMNDRSIQKNLYSITKDKNEQQLIVSLLSILPTLKPYEVNQIACGVVTYFRNIKAINANEHKLLIQYVKGGKYNSRIAKKLRSGKYSTEIGGAFISAILGNAESSVSSYGLIASGSAVVGAGVGIVVGGIAGGIGGGIAGAGAGSTVPGIGTVAGGVGGGIAGAGTGAIAGGAGGAAIGDAIGTFIEDVIDTVQDSTSTSDVQDGQPGESVMLGPNGEECTPPLFQF